MLKNAHHYSALTHQLYDALPARSFAKHDSNSVPVFLVSSDALSHNYASRILFSSVEKRAWAVLVVCNLNSF